MRHRPKAIGEKASLRFSELKGASLNFETRAFLYAQEKFR